MCIRDRYQRRVHGIIKMEERKVKDFASHATYKMLFHSLKHAKAHCYGVLLGKYDEGMIEVVDAIPLSHTPVLVPMLTVAFQMIEAHALEKKLNIVGSYELSSDVTEPSAVSLDIMQQIVEKNQRAALCSMIFPKKEMENKYSFGNRDFIFNTEDSNFKAISSAVKITSEACEYCVKTGMWTTLIDFDDHFENSDLDWRNSNFLLS
eukprot:TRINITY_DN42446_c0_g1_i4.p1 TRINITY_DN42446_c0_g1~~TRINITY_DN42446_c0_g1_i4.p1  ORF type:complete len:206 (+),score=40.56 TRINITY_DN42446_c0_g1_i4:166-783(+)